MKKSRKSIALLLAFVMSLALMVPVSAAYSGSSILDVYATVNGVRVDKVVSGTYFELNVVHEEANELLIQSGDRTSFGGYYSTECYSVDNGDGTYTFTLTVYAYDHNNSYNIWVDVGCFITFFIDYY